MPLPPPPVQSAQPTPTLVKQSWISSNWKGLTALVVVVIVVLAIVGLIFTQPWSKIKVIVYHDSYGAIELTVYIDGVLKASTEVASGTIVGVWSVTPGSHDVWVDRGSYMWGSPDFAYTYEVGPLTTKNVYVDLS